MQNNKKHVREFSVHKQNAIINYSSHSSLCVILYATKMTFYRAILIVHRACKLRLNERAQCNE